MFRYRKIAAIKLRPVHQESHRSVGNKTRVAALRHKPNIQPNGKHLQVKLKDGSTPILLSRQITDFCQPLVSIGEKQREKLLLDINTPIQKALYARFKQEFLKDEKDPEKIFNLVIHFVKTVCFPKDTEAAVNEITAAHQKKEAKDAKDEPEISIDEYLKAESGICRHYALQISALLSQLHKEKLLPPIRIYHYRANTNRGGHAWVMVKTENGIYLLDGLQDDKAHLMNNDLAKDPRLQKYGHHIAQECHKRLSESFPYAKANTEQRRHFLNALLESENPEEELEDYIHEIKFIIYDLEEMEKDASCDQKKRAALLERANKIQRMQPKPDEKGAKAAVARQQTLSYIPRAKLQRSPSIARLDLGGEEKLLVCSVASFAEALGNGSYGIARATSNPDIAIKLMRPKILTFTERGDYKLTAELDRHNEDLWFEAKYHSQSKIKEAIQNLCNVAALENEALFNRCINGIGAYCIVDAPIVMHMDEGKYWRVTSWPRAYLAVKKLKGIPLSRYNIDSELKFAHLCVAASEALLAIHAKGIVLEDIHAGNLLIEEYEENGATRIKVHYIDHTITRKESQALNVENLNLEMKPPEFKNVKAVIANKSHDIFCLGRTLQKAFTKYTDEQFENPNPHNRFAGNRHLPKSIQDAQKNLLAMQNANPAQRPNIQTCLQNFQSHQNSRHDWTTAAFQYIYSHPSSRTSNDHKRDRGNSHNYVASLRMCTDSHLKNKVFGSMREEGRQKLVTFLAEHYVGDPLIKRLYRAEPMLLITETQQLRNFLIHIKLTIANGYLKPKPGNFLSKWCSCLFTPGKTIKVDEKEVHVPLRASCMYHKLTAVDINTLDFTRLKELLRDIKKLAQEACKDDVERTKITHNFYNVLEDAECSENLSTYHLQKRFEEEVISYKEVSTGDYSRLFFRSY